MAAFQNIDFWQCFVCLFCGVEKDKKKLKKIYLKKNSLYNIYKKFMHDDIQKRLLEIDINIAGAKLCMADKNDK